MDLNAGDVITIDNNKDYAIIDLILYNNINYIYLANINDKEDIIIQKITGNKDDYDLTPLDNKEEVNILLELFLNKNKNKIEED